MLLRYVAKGLARLAFGLTLAVLAVPFASHEAAAGFGVSSPSDDGDKAAGGSKGGNTYTKEEIQAREEARKRAEEEAEQSPPPPPKPRAAKVVVPPPAPVVKKDEVVPGCTTGKICIVCIAGCNNAPREIVHSIVNKSPGKN